MRPAVLYLFSIIAASILLSSCRKSVDESGLRVTYGVNGIEHLSFNGVVLEDLAQYPSDAFHIWHIKASGLHGKVLNDRQYGWGEVNSGRKWNAATHTWLYSFIWGSVIVEFAQKANTLSMHVIETNNPASGITLCGVAIYPFVLHFPDLPKGFGDPSYQHLAVNAADAAPVADFGQGQVTSIAQPASRPLYHGFEPAGGGNNYSPIVSSTAMDSIPAGSPKLDRPIAPGESDAFTIDLQFADSSSESR